MSQSLFGSVDETWHIKTCKLPPLGLLSKEWRATANGLVLSVRLRRVFEVEEGPRKPRPPYVSVRTLAPKRRGEVDGGTARKKLTGRGAVRGESSSALRGIWWIVVRRAWRSVDCCSTYLESLNTQSSTTDDRAPKHVPSDVHVKSLKP